jgi:hypothetical protein
LATGTTGAKDSPIDGLCAAGWDWNARYGNRRERREGIGSTCAAAEENLTCDCEEAWQLIAAASSASTTATGEDHHA